MKDISYDRLIELLYYNPDAGVFRWRKSRGGRLVGTAAGSYNKKDGYVRIQVARKIYLAHRLAWFYIRGYWPDCDIDHINRVRADNRIVNLREANEQQTARNRSIRSDNTTGRPGVYWHQPTQKWQARIGLGGKAQSLGLFDSFSKACQVRQDAEIHHYGEFSP